jgi:hypothetical protein
MKQLAVALLAAGALSCGDGSIVIGPGFGLDDVQGLYQPETLTFDPQGAAPAGDVLDALAQSGFEPQLNIARNGTFQVPYRDPVTGEFRTLNGSARVVRQGLRLTFQTQADANQLVLPRDITLDWDPEEETLHFSGATNVSRIRLQQLFPELYGQEPWAGETIPGVLTARFRRTTSAGSP